MTNTLKNKPPPAGSPERDVSPADPAQRSSGVRAKAKRVPSSASLLTQPVLSQEPRIYIQCKAHPDLLEPTYAYLACVASKSFTPRLAERLKVAMYELYSNALRYGTAETGVSLELVQSQGNVRLVVTNRASPEHLQQLVQRVKFVEEDPAAAFGQELNSSSGDGERTPQLGIVRVAHEAELAIALRVDGNRVEVSVQGRND